jgi:hypothetical protein
MTQRTLDANLEAEATSSEFNYLVFVALQFPSGNVYLHNGIGTYSFGGNDYLGVGGFGTISALEDTLGGQVRPITLSLSSITPEIIDAVLTDDVYGRSADIYVGALNSDGELLGTPDNWFSGYMENSSINLGEEDGVSIRIQSRAARLNQRNNKRYTMEDHQAEFPGDMFFEFLQYLQDPNVAWGGEKVRTGYTNQTDGLTPSPGGGGGGGGGGKRGK